MAGQDRPTLPDEINTDHLLDGIYERDAFPDDLRERPVPDFGYNILNRSQNLYDPVADYEYLRMGGERPNWPDNADFAVCLTHDVDHVRSHSLIQNMRDKRARIKAKWRLRDFEGPSVVDSGVKSIIRTLARGAIHSINNTIYRNKKNFHALDRWTQIEQEFGVRSTFFILPPSSGPAHVSDGDYRLDDKIRYNGETRELKSVLIDLHNEGWEIGLHPSWYTFDNTELLLKEKKLLEEKLRIDISSVRQHWLHFDPVKTPRVHAEAGLKFDSTIGFNKNVGFRRGTSYPWQLRDLQTGEYTQVVEMPLIIQDVALHRRKGLDVPSPVAFEYIQRIIERVREVNGVLTLLWHPNAPDEFWRLYVRLLKKLNDENVWFGTMQEIGRHLLQENKSIVERNNIDQ